LFGYPVERDKGQAKWCGGGPGNNEAVSKEKLILACQEARAKTDPYLHLGFEFGVCVVAGSVRSTFIIMGADHAAATEGEQMRRD
jgi:hypothetical protein